MTEEVKAKHTLAEHQHGGPDCEHVTVQHGDHDGPSSTATMWTTSTTATARRTCRPLRRTLTPHKEKVGPGMFQGPLFCAGPGRPDKEEPLLKTAPAGIDLEAGSGGFSVSPTAGMAGIRRPSPPYVPDPACSCRGISCPLEGRSTTNPVAAFSRTAVMPSTTPSIVVNPGETATIVPSPAVRRKRKVPSPAW
jgi:hypothetical protein